MRIAGAIASPRRNCPTENQLFSFKNFSNNHHQSLLSVLRFLYIFFFIKLSSFENFVRFIEQMIDRSKTLVKETPIGRIAKDSVKVSQVSPKNLTGV